MQSRIGRCITLYIRKKEGLWINYLYNVQEMDSFIDALFSDKEVVIGDVSMFNQQMVNRLLKLLEERDNISLYSSTDLGNSVILSRVTKVVKEAPSFVPNGIEVDLYNDSPKDYQSVASNLSSLPNNIKLLCKKLSPRRLNLVVSVYSQSM